VWLSGSVIFPLTRLGIRMSSHFRLKFSGVAWMATVVFGLVSGCGEGTELNPVNGTSEGADKTPTTAAEKTDVTDLPGRDFVLRAKDKDARNDWFEDRTDNSKVMFRYSTGRDAEKRTILETLGGGVGIVDINNDQQLDLLCIGGGEIDRVSGIPTGRPSGLFLNRNGAYFTDVSESSGVNVSTDFSHACLGADLNNDGFCDIFITCFGRDSLLLNQGDGTFIESASQNFGQPRWSTAAAAGDINQDGSLDLFVTGYVDWVPSSDVHADVPAPQTYRPIADKLFLNTSDGGFRDISVDAGVRADGMGLGVVAADVNLDRNIDFYVANDVVANHLYVGNGTLSLTEVGESSGSSLNETGSPEGSMGVACEDVNGDGRSDFLVTNFQLEDNSLYLNLGGAIFQHATAAFGLAGIGRRQVGFGTGLQDFDNDNWPDLFVMNGHVQYSSQMSPFLQPSLLCRNDAGSRFSDITPVGGTWFRTFHAARGAATGDMDNNGTLDLVISSLSEPVALLYNRNAQVNWIRLKLVGTVSPRLPVGATVDVSAFERRCQRMLTSGAGYFSHSDSAMIFSLEPGRELIDAMVRWPSGLTELHRGLPALKESIIIEGRGQDQRQSPICRVNAAKSSAERFRHDPRK